MSFFIATILSGVPHIVQMFMLLFPTPKFDNLKAFSPTNAWPYANQTVLTHVVISLDAFKYTEV